MTAVDWPKAEQRADHIASFGLHPVDTWDGRAIHGVLAVAVAGLAARQRQPVAEVDTGSVLWHLDQGPSAVCELAAELGLASEDAQPARAASAWAWLTRPWPAQPPLANGDGMPRGIGRGSPKPAVEVVTLWACAATRDALAAERPTGLPSRTRVRVTGGEDEGCEGEVVCPAWLLDDKHRTVRPGPPHGYEVALDVPGAPSQARTRAVPTSDGGIVMTAAGPHGERVIVRAQDLSPQDE
ncbi:hypothetical protein [Streptomyces sp. NPDC087294]|uniref:hypothetical protein n=1 Tax=Streptomyces sp. NPDC087294 TaxID=3365777 RepID=UPI0038225BD3